MSQKITLPELYGAKNSLRNRLVRLKYIPSGGMGSVTKTPIAKINAFNDEIKSIKETYEKMLNQLNNVKITIEI